METRFNELQTKLTGVENNLTHIQTNLVGFTNAINALTKLYDSKSKKVKLNFCKFKEFK
jgi:hypothetical protein